MKKKIYIIEDFTIPFSRSYIKNDDNDVLTYDFSFFDKIS